MTAPLNRSSVLALAAALLLAGCATSPHKPPVAKAPDPVLPTSQYPLEAQTMTNSINLRVEAAGLSDNQRRALDLVAQKASWTTDEPVDVEIVTAGDPDAVAAGQRIGTYLLTHDVSSEALSQRSEKAQPGDVITVNLVYYRAHVAACNQTWENLSKTGDNKPYANFGCAVTANLAAQIADPRDLSRPAAPASADAGRRSVVYDHYRKGEITSATSDDSSKGNISDAIK